MIQRKKYTFLTSIVLIIISMQHNTSYTCAHNLIKIASILEKYRYPQKYTQAFNTKTPAPLLSNSAETIAEAIKLFHNTQGFRPTLYTLLMNLNDSGVHGYLFELEKAIALTKNNKTVCAFNKIIQQPSPPLKRQFDIMTNHPCWHECKNISWNKYNLETTKGCSTLFESQFLEQKQLVETYNEQHNTHVTFEVSSKQPIPSMWKQWFSHHNIAYSEGL